MEFSEYNIDFSEKNPRIFSNQVLLSTKSSILTIYNLDI